jgi:hypothetical protein
VRLKTTARTLAIVALLVAIYLGPRLHGIDRMMQTDEADWLGAAANVYSGLADGDLGATYQLPHPGATTQWAGVLAYVIELPDYPALHPDPVPYHRVDTVLRALRVDPMDLLIGARIVKLLFQLGLFLVAAWLLRRLFDPWVAATALLLIAFDPFLIGYDRLLHIDGLTASASFAAVLAIADAARQRDRRWPWALAGVLSALAWLTRFTAGVLGVVAVVAIVAVPLIALLRRRATVRETWVATSRPLLAYLGSSVVSTFVLWPTLIVDPVGTVRRMWAYVSNAATVGHELPTFYSGEIVHGDPGWVFYPDAIFWRLTPIALLGIVVLVASAVRRARVVLPRNVWLPVATALAFALLYAVLMDAGAKKFDRYILPVFPVLDLLAALGWVGLARLVWHATPRGRFRFDWRPSAAVGMVAVVVIAQAGSAWSDRHYGFDYYTPLRGGIASARHDMQLGAGEGMDQAAAFILGQPDGTTATIRTQNNQVTLLYFMPPTATVLDSGLANDAHGLVSWAATDYYVSYLPQWERDLNPVMQDQAARYPPIRTVAIDGIAFAHVYDLRTIPPPPTMVEALPCRWDFGNGAATLLTYDDQSVKRHPDDPNRRRLTLYFQTATDLPVDTPVRVRLMPRSADLTRITAFGTLQPSGGDGLLSTVALDITLPRGSTTAGYDIEVAVADMMTHHLRDVRPLAADKEPRDHAVANQCDGAGVVN